MTHHTFAEIVSRMIRHCEDTLVLKGEEYSRNGDRLWNFKVAARKLGCSPEEALLGMKVKHDVSIDDIVSEVQRGKLPAMPVLMEKFGDSINYNLLLLALILEKIHDNNGKPAQG